MHEAILAEYISLDKLADVCYTKKTSFGGLAQTGALVLKLDYGEMQEWLNWPLSKSGMGQLIEGSNPSLSATFSDNRVDTFTR